MAEKLYILELENDKYYVGKTTDIRKRFSQHQSGKGSVWTKEHAPIRILETRNITSIHDETNVTKDLMKKHGIENVRGGAYTAVDLPEHQEEAIRHELRSATDNCYKCGKKGHFANRCPKKSSFIGTCGCGKSFMVFEEFMSHNRMCLRRNVEDDSDSDEEDSEDEVKYSHYNPPKKQSGSCYRCGRAGHYSSDCYAGTHKRGYELD